MRLTAVHNAFLALLGAATTAQAQQYLLSELSFGHSGRLSPPENRGQIPNFALSGSDRQPTVLSNKVILTPISPGNQRGAIWSTATLKELEWVADIEFRANGPERGGGNLNIWLVSKGDAEVGSRSIYTVGRFDGLALVVDAHGGSAGRLRGFLNDGEVDYAARSSIDDQAFGHCDFPYRNLGRPSQIKIRQTRSNFRVEIDGRLCFESPQVSLPTGYSFGVTAATPDTPDSFEVFKLVVMSDKASTYGTGNKNTNANANAANSKDDKYGSRPQQPNPPKRNPTTPGSSSSGDADSFDEGLPDESPDIFQTSMSQFQDLHNRLQSTNHQLSSVYRSVSRHHQLDEKRHTEIRDLITGLQAELARINQIEPLQQRIKDLEKEVRGMRNDLGKKIQANERTFKGYLTDHHATLSQTLLDSVPGHGRLITIFIGSQIVLAVAYVVYKRRKAQSPKKFL